MLVFYRPEDIWGFKSAEDLHETQVILDFVNARLGHDVKLSLPLTTVLLKNTILFAGIAVVLKLLVTYKQHLISPTLWMGLALLGFLVCTSGVVYT